jgi:hypothetical protein
MSRADQRREIKRMLQQLEDERARICLPSIEATRRAEIAERQVRDISRECERLKRRVAELESR